MWGCPHPADPSPAAWTHPWNKTKPTGEPALLPPAVWILSFSEKFVQASGCRSVQVYSSIASWSRNQSFSLPAMHRDVSKVSSPSHRDSTSPPKVAGSSSPPQGVQAPAFPCLCALFVKGFGVKSFSRGIFFFFISASLFFQGWKHKLSHPDAILDLTPLLDLRELRTAAKIQTNK